MSQFAKMKIIKCEFTNTSVFCKIPDGGFLTEKYVNGRCDLIL